MKNFLKFFIIFILTIVSTVTFCNENNKVIKVALGYSGRSYDPHRHTDSSTLAITKQIYNNLFILNKEGRIEGELVESFQIEKNILKLKLKEKIYFQDGEELTAVIVKQSLERNKTIPVTKVLIDPIERIEVIDKYNLEIKSLTNINIVLHNFTHSSLAIVKKDKNGKLVGTGAFKLLDWGTGVKVILEKNENYFKEIPKVSRIEFVTIPEATNRFIALETNEVQIA
ncbi:ABC transporter substrate-binding protein, partial [Cetobacterium sp.]